MNTEQLLEIDRYVTALESLRDAEWRFAALAKREPCSGSAIKSMVAVFHLAEGASLAIDHLRALLTEVDRLTERVAQLEWKEGGKKL